METISRKRGILISTIAGEQAVLVRTVERLLPLFADRQPPWPEDDFEELQAKGAQLKLLLPEEPKPGRKGRLAVAHGLPLEAITENRGLAINTEAGGRGGKSPVPPGLRDHEEAWVIAESAIEFPRFRAIASIGK